MRIVLLFKSYGPYHLARLRSARERHEILALECSDIDNDYSWDVREKKRAMGIISLSCYGAKQTRGATVAEALTLELARFAPDAVAIPGYMEDFALSALRTCRARGTRAILMSDTHASTARQTAVRSIVKRRIVALYQAALVAGLPHASYLESLGFPRDKIAMGYDVVDNHHFAPPATDADCVAEVKSRYFFCCARLVEKKNLEVLMEAFSRYRQSAPLPHWDLVIAGDGPLREGLERQRSASPFAKDIHLIGHQTYDELPALYRAAGAFVFPSLFDEWGLAVNEAMAAGLPVLVSKRAGCSRDLVKDGVNGFAFDPSNIDALATLMRRLAVDEARVAMGRASRSIIAEWDVSRFAAGLTAATEMAMRPYPQRRHAIGQIFAVALSYRA